MVHFVLRRTFSVAQKLETSGAFGRGFNYLVEIELPKAGFEAEIDHVLKQVDHRALGVDFQLPEDSSSTHLCSWLHRQLVASVGAPLKTTWHRGDGLAITID